MTSEDTLKALAKLPKVELHVHLEGSIRPVTVVALARRHGDIVSVEEATARYQYEDFAGFLDAFKWVTSYLRKPEDYEFVAARLAEELAEQNVVYAEVIVALGVLLWRGQEPEPVFRALHRAAEEGRAAGVHLVWAPDVTRQFGSAAARQVADWAVRMKEFGVVAFGMGGDELSIPASEFRTAFDYSAENGLHCTVHAGEVGGPKEIYDAIHYLHAERIGHGIAAEHNADLRTLLRRRDIPLEICPTSNICTGALMKQRGRSARLEEHPLKRLFDDGVPVALSSDDPAMFHTTLLDEYQAGSRMGLDETELADIAQAGFAYSFLAESEKENYLSEFIRQRDLLRI
jgi:adenosine deaminase/aminodeoxyfutalosine deaminase